MVLISVSGRARHAIRRAHPSCMQGTPATMLTVSPSRPPRLLVVEGNVHDAREAYRASWGLTPAESYAAVVKSLAPAAICDIALPADEGANLPDPAGLGSYDGIFLTGSALHIYQSSPAVMQQIALMRAIYASGTPCFGSCWGIQIGSVAPAAVSRPIQRGGKLALRGVSR